MSNTPLLSICIPTFNRAAFLSHSLDKIVAQEPFIESANVEIVISDNCSTDSTQEVISLLIGRFPGKIIYYRNETNLKDENFELSLRRANGTFRKLISDTCLLADGTLAYLVKLVDITKSYQPIIFFTNGNHKSQDDVIYCTDLDSFLQHASFSSTWIGGFGIWADHLSEISDFSMYSKKQLSQADVLFRMIATKKHSVVLTRPFCSIQNTGRKSGYNIAEVFGKNYLNLLKQQLALGNISSTSYEMQKKNVLLQHIIPFYFSADHDFSRGGFFKHLEDYRDDQYFYDAIETMIFEKFKL